MASAPLLEAHAVRRGYRAGWLGLGAKRQILGSGLDLVVDAGERVLIAGPNGSGKSTLLRLLAGVEAADAGSVRIAGHAIATRAARRRIGYAPDGTPFPLELPAALLMRTVAGLAGLGAREARGAAERMLARVGLGADARRPLAHFSKGMRRRFTLGQALLAEPDVLLLDEPTDGLDAEGFGVLAELLDEARARAAAVVLASHVAALDCDRVQILMDGAWARIGTRSEVLDAPGGLLAAYRHLAQAGAL